MGLCTVQNCYKQVINRLIITLGVGQRDTEVWGTVAGWALLIFGLELDVLWGPLRELFPNSTTSLYSIGTLTITQTTQYRMYKYKYKYMYKYKERLQKG